MLRMVVTELLQNTGGLFPLFDCQQGGRGIVLSLGLNGRIRCSICCLELHNKGLRPVTLCLLLLCLFIDCGCLAFVQD